MKSIIFSLLVIASITSCNQGNVSAPAVSISTDGYEVHSLDGFDKLVKKNEEGIKIEEGHIQEGLKTGSWLTYDKQGNLIGITNYIKGKMNGPYLELNNRGQIIKKQYYKNNVLHGPFGEYKFGRTEKEGTYKEGQLDGMYREYYNNSKVQREINYTDGKIDGLMTYYKEDDGSIMLQYEYRNGEKIREVPLTE